MTFDPKHAKRIFQQAVDLTDPGRRCGFVAEQCGDDSELKARVDVLLANHRDSFALPSPIDGTFQPPNGYAAPPDDSPYCDTVIAGRYTLIERIGDGGMGEVWMAEQSQPVQRVVALKLIKRGMDSRQILARFDAERQALALMDHPNIATIHDAGEHAQRQPYFVMELVKGPAITHYCDERKYTLRQRLELILPVCHAIQHAHLKGIIHRDIKPNNVLVAQYDGRPVPKVIDFGIAKAASGPLTKSPPHTGFGSVVGTPQYMSPEQAELNQLDIDTRSDVYSLGVMLYELLTGSTPFDAKRLEGAGVLEVLRMIREDEPTTPSTKLSSADTLPSIAANRNVTPKALPSIVRGELDWIVMRALEKDRNRRYESAGALAADIQRYLDGEAVEACPPSVTYRAKKYVRKHRGTVVAASLVFSALALGLCGTTWGMMEARAATENERKAKNAAIEQKRLADEHARKADLNAKRAFNEMKIAEAERRFLLTDLLGQADVHAQAASIRAGGGGFEVKENPTIKELLERAAAQVTAERIETKFPGQKQLQAAVLAALGAAFRGVGDGRRATEHLRRAVELSVTAFGEDDENNLCMMKNLATVLTENGQASEAVEMYQRIRDIRVRKNGPNDPSTLNCLNCLALAISERGKPNEALELQESIYNQQMERLGPAHRDTWATMNNWAMTLADVRKFSQAIELMERLRDEQIKAIGPTDPDVLMTVNNLGLIYNLSNQNDKAIALHEEAVAKHTKLLGPDHHQTLRAAHNLGWAYFSARKFPKAAEILEDVLARRSRVLGPTSESTLNTMYKTANANFQAFTPKSSRRAAELWEKLHELRLAQYGPEHEKTITLVNNLAFTYRNVPDYAKSMANFKKLLAHHRTALGDEHRTTQYILYQYAIICKQGGAHETALPLFQEAVALAERNGWKDANSHRMVGNLIQTLEKLGRAEEAEEWRTKQPPEKR